MRKIDKSNRLSIVIKKENKRKSSETTTFSVDDQFMQNMAALEDGEEKQIFEILDIEPSEYPPSHCLSYRELRLKFRQLEKILEEHSFFLELSPKLPVRNAYRYLTENFLYEWETVLPPVWRCHVTGCGGDCPSCFQMEFCEMKNEIWSQEKLLAELVRRRKRESRKSRS